MQETVIEKRDKASLSGIDGKQEWMLMFEI